MQKNFDYIKFAHISPTSQNFHLRFVLLKIDFLSCIDIIEPVYIKNCLQVNHISSRQFSFINYYIQQQQYFYLEKTENLNENSKSLQ